ncbi:MAG TPA: MFS transporter, partial [Methylophaga sp.]|nr:MFS transporter [Methylophaga sp.]
MTAAHSLRNYAVITGGYWAFTLTDGAIRMLIVLYFHQLGYTPLAIASLFLFYEFFGIVTNLVGGWLGARFGLNTTMHIGMLLQVFALLMLTVPTEYLTIFYVMSAQALSGIAKDLNKMSAKASVKLFVPSETSEHTTSKTLFKWIAILTGSKNTLKGVGFFLGGLLLAVYGFSGALFVLAGCLFIVLVMT